MSNSKVDGKVLDIIQYTVMHLEIGNSKTHEKTDAEMASEIVKIIKKEVDRIEN